jgi:hypothetical protein
MPQAHRKTKDTSQANSGRNAARCPGRRHATLWRSGFRVLVSGALLAVLHWAVPHLEPLSILRRIPHSAIEVLSVAAATVLGLFLVVEITLLAGAVATINKPKLHQRFKVLMIYWPTALVTPLAIMINRRLQRQLLAIQIPRHVVRQPAHKRRRSAHRSSVRGSFVRAKEMKRETSSNNPHLMDGDDIPKPPEHTSPQANLDDYRRAMALLIRRAELLQQDQDLLNLCLRLLTSAEAVKEIHNEPSN